MVKAKNTGADFELVPTGLKDAVISMIVDIGTHEVNDQGTLSEKLKIQFAFTVFYNDPETNSLKSGVVYQEITNTTSDKGRLKPLIEAVIGRELTDAEMLEYDLDNILGKPIQTKIKHKESKGRVYANIDTVVDARPDFEPPADLQLLTLSLEEDHFSLDVFDKLPQFVKDKIEKSPEFKALNGEVPASA